MSPSKSFLRSIALTASLTLIGGTAAMAQNGRYDRTAANGYANRVVEGTVASVVHERNGDRVRMTNGMDLLVPTSITGMRQGRRFGASSLRPGDVVRLNVYSRQGDGRDAEVRSIEYVESNGAYNNGTYRNDGMNRNNNGMRRNNAYRNTQIAGSVVSIDRRARRIVVQADNGQAVTVDVSGSNNASWNSYRRGDRVVVDGVTRNGMFIATDLRR